MIHFLDVSKYFGNRLIFDQINCHIEMASFNCLIGANGSGKSIFFQLILKQTRPNGGEILFLQQPLSRLKDSALAQHRQHIGMIHQKHRFFAHKTAQNNILLPLTLQKKVLPKQDEKMQEWGEQLGLLEGFNRPVSQLSLGEQQCVSVLRALIHEPILILADDPLQHLSADLAKGVMELLHAAYLAGTTVIVAAQSMNFLPDAARVWRIEQYQIQEH